MLLQNPCHVKGEADISTNVDVYIGEGNGTHSSTLAWKIPWTEERGGPQSMGSLRVGHN